MEHTTKPQMGDRALTDGIARRAREAEALRDNLRRRKQQARERAEPVTGLAEAAPSAGSNAGTPDVG